MAMRSKLACVLFLRVKKQNNCVTGMGQDRTVAVLFCYFVYSEIFSDLEVWNFRRSCLRGSPADV